VLFFAVTPLNTPEISPGPFPLLRFDIICHGSGFRAASTKPVVECH
jgi:hypothetical protein